MHVIQKELLSIHTMSDELIIAFYQKAVCLHDQNLDCKKQIAWNKALPVDVSLLTNFGIAPNNADCQETGLICGFGISRTNAKEFPCKSVYESRLANLSWSGKVWLVRLMLNDDSTGLISYNEINESMVFVDEQPMYPFEF